MSFTDYCCHTDFKTTGQHCSLLLWMAKKICDDVKKMWNSVEYCCNRERTKRKTGNLENRRAKRHIYMTRGIQEQALHYICLCDHHCSVYNYRPKGPNHSSKCQQMTEQDDAGVTGIQMYETQANRGRGHKMGPKNAHLMLRMGDLVCLPGVHSSRKSALASGGIPIPSSSSQLQNHSPSSTGRRQNCLSSDWKWVMVFSVWWCLFSKHPPTPLLSKRKMWL